VVRNADPAGKPGFWTVTNGLLTILGFVLALGTVIIKGAVEDARVSTEKQIAAVDSRVSEHHEASEKASDKLDRGLQELSDRLSNMEGVERERGRTFDRVNQFLDRGDRMKEALDGAERRINEFGQQLETQRADALRVRTTTLQTVEKVEMALKQLGEPEAIRVSSCTEQFCPAALSTIDALLEDLVNNWGFGTTVDQPRTAQRDKYQQTPLDVVKQRRTATLQHPESISHIARFRGFLKSGERIDPELDLHLRAELRDRISDGLSALDASIARKDELVALCARSGLVDHTVGSLATVGELLAEQKRKLTLANEWLAKADS